MKRSIKKRLERVTQSRGETLRVVSVRDGEPAPGAAAGELLIVISRFSDWAQQVAQ